MTQRNRRGGSCASTSDVACSNAATNRRMTPNTLETAATRDDDDASRLDPSRGSPLEPLRRVLLALAPRPGHPVHAGHELRVRVVLLVLDKDEGLGSRDKDAAKHALEECAFWLMRAVLQDVLPGYFASRASPRSARPGRAGRRVPGGRADAHAALEKTGCRCAASRRGGCCASGGHRARRRAALRVWDHALLDAPGGAFDSCETSAGRCARAPCPRCVSGPGTCCGGARWRCSGEPGARGDRRAPGAADVQRERAAGRGVTDLQAFDATRARPVARRAPRRPEGGAGLHGGGLAAAAAAASRGPPRRNAAAATARRAAATTPPRARDAAERARRSRHSAPCSRRCAARPLGSPRSRARCAGGSSVSAATEAATRAEGWRGGSRVAARARSVVGKGFRPRAKTASTWTAGAARRRADAASPASTPWPPGRRLLRCPVRCARLARVRTRVAARDPVTARAHALRRGEAPARSQTRRVF